MLNHIALPAELKESWVYMFLLRMQSSGLLLKVLDALAWVEETPFIESLVALLNILNSWSVSVNKMLRSKILQHEPESQSVPG